MNFFYRLSCNIISKVEHFFNSFPILKKKVGENLHLIRQFLSEDTTYVYIHYKNLENIHVHIPLYKYEFLLKFEIAHYAPIETVRTGRLESSTWKNRRFPLRAPRSQPESKRWDFPRIFRTGGFARATAECKFGTNTHSEDIRLFTRLLRS